MISSRAAAARPAIRAVGQQHATRQFSTSPVPQATLRELETRLKSVRNIEKVTKSMKMIATTKLNKAQEAMKTAKLYGETTGQIFTESETGKSADGEEASAVVPGGKTLWIVASSDKGLCGGIHSSVTKKWRKETAGLDLQDTSLVILGDKGKAQLSRLAPKSIVLSFNQVGKQIPTFNDALAIAELIEDSKTEFEKVNLIYNKVISAISYEAVVMEVYNAAALNKAPKIAAYEIEEDTYAADLADFALANSIYAALVEGHAAEISARRNAMDNASKNAGDMMGKLQMQFNRMRQSQITNDLVDIVTGANALE